MISIGFDTKNRSPASIKVEYLLLEVVLDLLHPILDLQVKLRLLNMVSNDSLYSKHVIDSLTKSLACSEAGLLLGVIQNLICPRTKNTHFLEKIQFVA